MRMRQFLALDKYLLGVHVASLVQGGLDAFVPIIVIRPMIAVIINKSASDPHNSAPEVSAFTNMIVLNVVYIERYL